MSAGVRPRIPRHFVIATTRALYSRNARGSTVAHGRSPKGLPCDATATSAKSLPSQIPARAGFELEGINMLIRFLTRNNWLRSASCGGRRGGRMTALQPNSGPFILNPSSQIRDDSGVKSIVQFSCLSDHLEYRPRIHPDWAPPADSSLRGTVFTIASCCPCLKSPAPVRMRACRQRPRACRALKPPLRAAAARPWPRWARDRRKPCAAHAPAPR